MLSALGISVAAINAKVELLDIIFVFVANYLSFAFAFMINDIEDADDDALDEKKRIRNPVSAKKISINTAYIATFITAAVSLFLYLLVNKAAFAIGSIALILGFIYSWKKIRLKSKPLIDILSHALFLSLLIFLAAAASGGKLPPLITLLWAGTSLFLFSGLEDIRNELRDFAVDKESKLKNTAQVFNLIGLKKYLAYLSVAVALSLVTFFMYALAPTARLMLGLLIILPISHLIYLIKVRGKTIYEYPYMQPLLIAIGTLLLADAVF